MCGVLLTKANYKLNQVVLAKATSARQRLHYNHGLALRLQTEVHVIDGLLNTRVLVTQAQALVHVQGLPVQRLSLKVLSLGVDAVCKVIDVDGDVKVLVTQPTLAHVQGLPVQRLSLRELALTVDASNKADEVEGDVRVLVTQQMPAHV